MRRPLQFGKYLLLERINVGGMAEVFMRQGASASRASSGSSPSSGSSRTMAEDAEFVTMFIDEARIAAQLTHAEHRPDLRPRPRSTETYLHRHGVRAGARLCAAVLERASASGPIMPAAQARAHRSQVCDGARLRATASRTRAARPLHIVHRDVSPQNILVSFDGEVKLIDFGIAKAAEPAARRPRRASLKGKFGYMSPEQVQGLDASIAARTSSRSAWCSTRCSPASASSPASRTSRSSSGSGMRW